MVEQTSSFASIPSVTATKRVEIPITEKRVVRLFYTAPSRGSHYKTRACLAAFFWAAFLKTRPKTT